MNIKLFFSRITCVTLCFLLAVAACAQEPKKKPKIISSGKTETTVYKPLAEQKQTEKEQTPQKKEKPAAQQKKKATAAPKQATIKKSKNKQRKAEAAKDASQVKNAAKATASKKQATGKGKAQVQAKKKDKRKKIVKGEKPTQMKGKKQAGKPASSAEAKAAAKKRSAQAKGKQQQKKKQQPKKQKKEKRYIALKSNVPFQALSIHNLAVEVQVHKQITVDFPVMWSISDIEREHAVRGIAFQPEGRWWLKKAGTGHFFGVHAHAAWFNLKWEDNRYQTGKRPLLGAGISYGYKLPLSAHWGAEFNIGAGYANMKYDTFYNIENGAQLDTRIRHYWGITRAGISLVYRF